MKLSFNVTLNVSVPEGYDLTDDDIETYRNVLNHAVAHQAGFGGLTPDYLSNENVGVTSFYVATDPRLTQEPTARRLRSGGHLKTSKITL